MTCGHKNLWRVILPCVLAVGALAQDPGLIGTTPPRIEPKISDVQVANLHVVDEHVLRGAQPGEEGLRGLALYGVKTILNLREGQEHEEAEQKLAESLHLQFKSVPLAGFGAPSDEEIAAALKVLNDKSAWPVFVHCKYGKDRTGTVIACYRVAHDGWSNQQALEEARKYGIHVYERAMRHYILTYKPIGGTSGAGTH